LYIKKNRTMILYIVASLFLALGFIFIRYCYLRHFRYVYNNHLLSKQLAVALKAGNTSVWGINLKKQEAYNINGNVFPTPRMPLSEVLLFFYSDEDIQKFQAAVDDVVSAKVDIAEVTVRYQSDVNQKYEYIHCEITGIKNRRGEIVRLVGTHRIVTQEIEIQQTLEEAKLKAEESNQFKMLFLASMSHEIRTPLNAIVGFSNLLNEVDDPEERESYVEIINNNSDLLLTLVNDILDLSKIENGSMQISRRKVDLVHDMMNFEKIAINLAKKKKKNAQIKVIHGYKGLVLCIDKEKFHRILYNFLTNALKYTHDNGQIDIQYIYQDGQFYFSVKDNGIGIPEDKKDRVFSRFEKLDTFAKGTGLGLSLCKSLIENLGGDIGFDSKEGEGSTFWASTTVECFDLVEG